MQNLYTSIAIFLLFFNTLANISCQIQNQGFKKDTVNRNKLILQYDTIFVRHDTVIVEENNKLKTENMEIKYQLSATTSILNSLFLFGNHNFTTSNGTNLSIDKFQIINLGIKTSLNLNHYILSAGLELSTIKETYTFNTVENDSKKIGYKSVLADTFYYQYPDHIEPVIVYDTIWLYGNEQRGISNKIIEGYDFLNVYLKLVWLKTYRKTFIDVGISVNSSILLTSNQEIFENQPDSVRDQLTSKVKRVNLYPDLYLEAGYFLRKNLALRGSFLYGLHFSSLADSRFPLFDNTTNLSFGLGLEYIF
jgi:hypothetical protein